MFGQAVPCSRFFLGFILCQGEAHADDELRAFPLLRFHFDGAAHQVHQALGDGHAQARALDVVHRRGAFPFVGFKDLGREFLAHAHTSILHVQVVETRFPVGAGLVQGHRDAAPLGRKLVGVADQVQQDAVQAAHVAQHRPVGNARCCHRVMQPLGLHLGHEHIADFVHGLHQVGLLQFQLDLTAFNTAHIQHVVDQGQQVLAGCLDLCQVIFRFRRKVFLLAGQHSVPDNRVHGRADVVAHVGKEGTLGAGTLLRRPLLPFRLPFPGQDETEDQEQDHHDDEDHAEHHVHLHIQVVSQPV